MVVVEEGVRGENRLRRRFVRPPAPPRLTSAEVRGGGGDRGGDGECSPPAVRAEKADRALNAPAGFTVAPNGEADVVNTPGERGFSSAASGSVEGARVLCVHDNRGNVSRALAAAVRRWMEFGTVA